MDKNSTTIRISKETYESAKAIARKKNEKIQNVFEEAMKEYTRVQFFQELNAAFARLKSDSAAWSETLKESEEWAGTLLDGLQDEDASK